MICCLPCIIACHFFLICLKLQEFWDVPNVFFLFAGALYFMSPVQNSPLQMQELFSGHSALLPSLSLSHTHTHMEKMKFSPSVLRCLAISLLFLHFTKLSSSVPRTTVKGKGRWELLLNNTGVIAMHMALTHHNTVIIFDQVGAPSGYRLRHRFNGARCKNTRTDLAESSCYAHSVEYNIMSNKVRALNLLTDTWCSSGSILTNGTIVQTGGHGRGSRRIRYYKPCKNGVCDWKQSRRWLSDGRWYASSLHLPEDDRVLVVGGRGAFTYEFVPKSSRVNHSLALPFLHQTYDKDEGGNNLYPFLHLSSDGNIFIFANRDSILFDYRTHKVVKTFPKMPSRGGSRSYPSTGSSVILPIDSSGRVEVMICGGGAAGAYTAAHTTSRKRKFLTGLSSCGRMVITGNSHKWKMETMLGPRVMSDMLLLPTGDVLIINGAKQGVAGWNSAINPAFEPYLYSPKKTLGHRFTVLRRTKIARLYHSSAVLLPDGRILVAGGNPNRGYEYNNVRYPTELRLQAFIPDYMERKYDYSRPKNVSVRYYGGNEGVVHGGRFGVAFRLDTHPRMNVKFTAYAPPFTTHSLSMNQRLVKLRCVKLTNEEDHWTAIIVAPPVYHVAPAGYYLLTVVHEGIPSESQWLKIVGHGTH